MTGIWLLMIEIGACMKTRVLVVDDVLLWESATLVVSDAADTVILQRPTIIGGED